MQKPRRVTAPADLPVSVAEARLHLRANSDEPDSQIEGWIRAAVDKLDGWSGALGRCMVTQVWDFRVPSFGSGLIRLPFPDVQGVAISYLDADRAVQVLPDAAFDLYDDDFGSYLRAVDFAALPVTAAADGAVTIRMTVGYGNPDKVPADIRQAVLQLCGHFDRNREMHAEGIKDSLPAYVISLIDNHRRLGPHW